MSDYAGNVWSIGDVMLGSRIRHYRKAAGLTQAELGAKLGVTQGLVSRWENGDKSVPPERIEEIAQTLDAPVGDLTRAARQEEVPEVYEGYVRTDKERERWRDMLVEAGLPHTVLLVLSALPKHLDEGVSTVVVAVEDLAARTGLSPDEVKSARVPMLQTGFVEVTGTPETQSRDVWGLHLRFPA